MEPILGPIVGGVTNNKTKVWVFWNSAGREEEIPQCDLYKDESCKYKISTTPFQTVSSSVHKNESINGLAGLAKLDLPPNLEQVYFKIRLGSAEEQNDQIYTIRPFPEPNSNIDTLSFALISCHRPVYQKDKDEKITVPMWRFLREEMLRHNCSFLIQAGDQVYSDYKGFNAWEWSLGEKSPEKRLWYYRQVYLKSWSYQEINEVFRRFPQYMIWDDHEITNGWGSNMEHSDKEHQSIFEIARQAYIEFQHCHNPDPLRSGELYFTFNYGPVAFLFMDLRGHRLISLYDNKTPSDTFPLAGKEQWDDIEAWLKSSIVQQSKLLFVITSVPVCHLSRKLGSFGIFKNDVRDQWSTPHNKKEKRILLNLLYDWSGDTRKPVFILGGDVHVGTVAQMIEKESGKTIHQITSSPITNAPAFLLDLVLQYFSSEFEFHLDQNRLVSAKIVKRYRKRNFAIIKIQFSGDQPKVELYMYEKGKKEPEIYPFI